MLKLLSILYYLSFLLVVWLYYGSSCASYEPIQETLSPFYNAILGLVHIGRLFALVIHLHHLHLHPLILLLTQAMVLVPLLPPTHHPHRHLNCLAFYFFLPS